MSLERKPIIIRDILYDVHAEYEDRDKYVVSQGSKEDAKAEIERLFYEQKESNLSTLTHIYVEMKQFVDHQWKDLGKVWEWNKSEVAKIQFVVKPVYKQISCQPVCAYDDKNMAIKEFERRIKDNTNEQFNEQLANEQLASVHVTEQHLRTDGSLIEELPLRDWYAPVRVSELIEKLQDHLKKHGNTHVLVIDPCEYDDVDADFVCGTNKNNDFCLFLYP